MKETTWGLWNPSSDPQWENQRKINEKQGTCQHLRLLVINQVCFYIVSDYSQFTATFWHILFVWEAGVNSCIRKCFFRGLRDAAHPHQRSSSAYWSVSHVCLHTAPTAPNSTSNGTGKCQAWYKVSHREASLWNISWKFCNIH